MRSLLPLLVALFLGLALVGRAGTVHAEEDAAALIKKGRELFEEQSYQESIQTLSAVVARKDIPKEQRLEALQLMAYNHIVLGNLDQARGVVWAIYVEDEDFELPETESPRFRDFFAKSKEEWIEEGKPGVSANKTSTVRIKHSPPSEAEAGLPISLSGVVEDPDAVVSKLRLFYRTGSEGKFTQVRLKFAMRKFSAEIPGDIVEPPLVEYYFEAVDKVGLPVATRGDADAPLRITIPEEGGSVITSPWLWVPVSIAVVAAILTPVLYVTLSSQESTVSVNVFER